MRIVMLALLLTGCSVAFMERLPPGFDAQKSEPRCTAGKGFVAWDGLIAASATLTTGLLLTAGEDAGLQPFAAVSAIEAVVHLVSAFKGNGWANECDRARRARDRSAAPTTPTVTAPAPNASRYFCSGSTCAGDQASCERARLEAGDAASCAPVERAFCFPLGGGEVCSPTAEACERRRLGAASLANCSESR